MADATTPTCGTAAPAAVGATGWDASATAYAAKWTYSDGGQIKSLVKGAAGAPTTSTYAYTDTAHPAAVTQVTGGTTTDSFGYDGAGRMVSRTVGGVSTALTWDVTSSLVESNGQGGHVVYAYDASGQRVVQARVADANGVGTATAYVASGQVDDANTAPTSTGVTTATRYYTFGGSTVAVRTSDPTVVHTDPVKLFLMLGDEQGSTNVMMPVTVQTDGTLAKATLADAAASTRSSYTPYGELRGTVDNTATDRGWLGQVEDRVVGTGASSTGTGLTYLNARYYDPATSRFISPDPLMNPGDPKTLDPYRYADNNPVVFTDATGLRSTCADSASNEAACAGSAANKGVDYHTGSTKVVHSRATTKPKPSVPSIGSGGIGVVPPVGGGTGLSSINWGEFAGDSAAATGASALKNYGKIASGLLRKGTHIGWFLMHQLRGKPWLRHTLRVSGRLGSNATLGTTDAAFAVASAADNYLFRYSDMERQSDRIQFTLERTVVTEGSGFAVGLATDKVAVAACGLTEGFGCAPAIIVSSVVQTAVSEGSGLLYDWLNEGRVAAASGDETRRRRFMASDLLDWSW